MSLDIQYYDNFIFCSIEVGSCIATQVCMLQIPILVLVDVIHVSKLALKLEMLKLSHHCTEWLTANILLPFIAKKFKILNFIPMRMLIFFSKISGLIRI